MPKYSKTAFQLKSTDGNLHALRGRLGDFIFRTRNGKIFAFYKPKQGRFIPDPISVQLREITTKLNLEIVNRKSSNRKSSWLPKRSTTDSIIEPEKSSPSSTCYSSWSASKKSTTNPFPTPILKPSSATLGNQIIVRQLRTGKLFVRKFAKPPKLWAYLHSISKFNRYATTEHPTHNGIRPQFWRHRIIVLRSLHRPRRPNPWIAPRRVRGSSHLLRRADGHRLRL